MRPVQCQKAYSPILVTEFGIVIDVRPVQPPKAEEPILVTEFGIVMDVRLVQPPKAPSPTLVTLYTTSSTVIVSGIVTSSKYPKPYVTSTALPPAI